MSFFHRRPLTVRLQIEFTERLAYLLGAGISLLESLSLLEMHMRSNRSKKSIESIIESIGSGESFSSSVKTFRILDDFSVCALGIGETTGALADTLRSIADQLKKSSALQKKLLGTMIYPTIILLTTIGLTVFLIGVIFPKIKPLFTDLHVVLPFPTRVLIFLGTISPAVIIGSIGGIMLLSLATVVSYKKSIIVRWYVQKLLARMPVVGHVRRDVALANLLRMLGMLLQSGTGLQASFVIMRDASVDLLYKNECITTAQRLGRGEQLSETLKIRPYFFPPAIVGFLTIGELTGNLSEISFKASTMIETDIDENIKKLSALVEPMLMLAMGTIVGFVALAIITPLYAITQNIK